MLPGLKNYVKKNDDPQNPERKWRDRLVIYTETIRKDTAEGLAQKHNMGNVGGIEICLNEEHPYTDVFNGVLSILPEGVWFYDGDGAIDEVIFRSYFIPMAMIASIALHQAT